MNDFYRPTTKATQSARVASWLMSACGIWLIALGVYFMFVRPPLLPEDARFMGGTVAQIHAVVPGLTKWLTRVFTVMGGFITSAGVLTVFVARVAMPLRLRYTSWTIALAGVVSVALMAATNFAIHSDFRWILLIPFLIWLVGFGIYVDFAQPHATAEQ